jgi:hypothetical protein
MRDRWRSRIAALVPLLFLGAGGCLELSPVEPPPRAPSVLTLSLQMAVDSPATPSDPVPVRVHATLALGMDGRGRPHELEGDTLRVWGSGVRLSPSVEGGPLLASGELGVPGELVWGAPITIVPPRLSGLPAAPLELQWPRIRRLDADTVRHTAGSDLDLRLELVRSGPSTPEPEWRWVVSLGLPGRWVSFGADEAPPAVIRVPAEFLPREAAVFGILVFVDQRASHPLSGVAYGARVSVQQQLRWVVSTAPPQLD